ncbi:uncharacterized protein TM35_000651160 [Trypanosoma theileri]|uniref:Uncharacterized protein n=1 Tax=Trypanosoma theileri TaxID=67003 RepID=A0A1X0NFP6_9TRYP|nr:uncharacterized protein TM35_000651160 [Trypanosoma theileri]ORC83554.1 hypothetical protein TM35_000651160 [Trypanosoma theileri]
MCVDQRKGATPPLQSLTHMSVDIATPSFSAPHSRRSGAVQQHKVSFPLTVHTHTMTVSHSHIREALRQFTKMYTESHTYREEEKNTRAAEEKEQQQQDTKSTQSTHNTIITGVTPIREKHSPTPAHQLNPNTKRKKKQTHYVKPKRNSFTPPPRRLQSLKQATQQTTQGHKYLRGNAA